MKTCENLHVEEQHRINILLKKYDYVFNVILGDLSMETTTTNTQMMHPICKPIYWLSYNVNISVEQQLKQRK
jgi:hypothetical protein